MPDVVMLHTGRRGEPAGRFFRKPIEHDREFPFVLLRCAEPGQSHVTRWVRENELAQAEGV